MTLGVYRRTQINDQEINDAIAAGQNPADSQELDDNDDP